MFEVFKCGSRIYTRSNWCCRYLSTCCFSSFFYTRPWNWHDETSSKKNCLSKPELPLEGKLLDLTDFENELLSTSKDESFTISDWFPPLKPQNTLLHLESKFSGGLESDEKDTSGPTSSSTQTFLSSQGIFEPIEDDDVLLAPVIVHDQFRRSFPFHETLNSGFNGSACSERLVTDTRPHKSRIEFDGIEAKQFFQGSWEVDTPSDQNDSMSPSNRHFVEPEEAQART